MTDSIIPIVNASDASWTRQAWHLKFGAYATTHLYVFANGVEAAFEHAVEWLDDHAPGLLDRVTEHAEADMAMIGHTTLKNGNAVASWEWWVDEVTGSELDALRARICSECEYVEVSEPGLCAECAAEAAETADEEPL